MNAKQFMILIKNGKVDFESLYKIETYGYLFDFAEAYHKHELKNNPGVCPTCNKPFEDCLTDGCTSINARYDT